MLGGSLHEFACKHTCISENVTRKRIVFASMIQTAAPENACIMTRARVSVDKIDEPHVTVNDCLYVQTDVSFPVPESILAIMRNLHRNMSSIDQSPYMRESPDPVELLV